ncbi:helix-turn-helix domain-containing protein [Micromonospora sp. WMMD1219]|uniref:helix-turn-helix domain-containing protein n=1 Tax=Micromonospora sp. WMMD1219 TaxID=3404115 RepID=UPI003BF48E1B
MDANGRREAIAAEVRAELARQRKTQRDAAEILDLPQPSVQLRLAGKRSFRAEELTTLADALGVPVAQFLTTPERVG